jgi:hypothetical protein
LALALGRWSKWAKYLSKTVVFLPSWIACDDIELGIASLNLRPHHSEDEGYNSAAVDEHWSLFSVKSIKSFVRNLIWKTAITLVWC